MTGRSKDGSLSSKNRIYAIERRIPKTQAPALGMKPTKPASPSPVSEHATRQPDFRNHPGHRNADRHARVRPTGRRGLRGFTLTELLVVIAILAVLAIITFSVAGKFRDKAKSATCAQNLRQIGVGLMGHISENNGRFPNGSLDVSWSRDENGNSLGLCWYDAAAAYMGRDNASTRFNDPDADPLPDVFACPSGLGKAYHPAWPYTGDYAANMFLGNPSNPNNPMRLAALKRPEATPYVQDTVKQNQFGQAIYGSGFSRTANAAFATRHNERGNILWVDGHVTSLRYEEYMSFANDPRHGGPNNFIRGNW